MNYEFCLSELTSGVVNGPLILSDLRGWLSPFDELQQDSEINDFMPSIYEHEIELFEQTALDLYQSRLRYGGSSCRFIAKIFLNEVSLVLREGQPTAVEKRLFRAMASLADTFAVMNWHQGWEYSAQDYFRLALLAANVSDDRLYCCRILAGLSMQMIYNHQANKALDLIFLAQGIYSAQQKNNAVASFQVKAMLFLHEAWAYAAKGDANEFYRALNCAEESLIQVNQQDEPYWAWFCDQGELASIAAAGLRLLAKENPNEYAEQASEFNARALEIRGTEVCRDTVLDYIGLAECRFLLNDIDLGISATEQALLVYEKIYYRCGEVRRRLRELCQVIAQMKKSTQLRHLNKKIFKALMLSLNL